MWPKPLTPSRSAVFAASLPCLPCASCGRASSPPATPVAFPERTPSAVSALVLSTSWVQHSHRALTSLLLTPLLLTCNLQAILLLSPRIPRFAFRGGFPTLLPQVRLPRETIFLALMGCFATIQCCCHRSTVSIEEFSYQSMSCGASIFARTPRTSAKKGMERRLRNLTSVGFES